jgi:hypothetical protein
MLIKPRLHFFFQREYEEFKVRINALVAKAQKVPEEGWTMQDGTPWPGNNVRDHPGMIQVSHMVCCYNYIVLILACYAHLFIFLSLFHGESNFSVKIGLSWPKWRS